MTLDSLLFRLQGIFAPEQLYTALLTFGEHLEVFSQVSHEQLSHTVASWLVRSVLPI